MAEAPSNGPLVLMVDDDADLLHFAAPFLERLGLRVVTAPNGRRALAMLDAIRPDVIVTDLVMPELDGLRFLEAYRSRPEPGVPVIATSGFSPYLAEAGRLGADATVAKPYDPNALGRLVLDMAQGLRPKHEEVAPVQEDERARLRALFDLRLEDWATESRMRRFLDEVAALFTVPIAGVSAVTEERQRLVVQCSAARTEDPGGPRDQSFCTHAVAARAALLVQDASQNSLFRDNPNVTERGFQFYAGVPLLATRGHAIGTLCILDFRPRSFTHFDLELLGLLGQRVVAALEWRDKRAHPKVPDSAFRCLQCIDPQLDIYGKSLFSDLIVVEASRCMHGGTATALAAVAVPPERLDKTVEALREAVRGGIIGRLGLARLGVLAPGMTGDQVRQIAKRCAGEDARIAVADLDHYQGGAMAMALLQLEQSLGDAGLA